MLLKTFAKAEHSSRGEEVNEEIHMALTGISLHMLPMELPQELGAKENMTQLRSAPH